MYDSPSDSSVEESVDEILLHGDADEVDRLLQDGASLDILESPRWDFFVKNFLLLEIKEENLLRTLFALNKFSVKEGVVDVKFYRFLDFFFNF